jgi:PadR family transcriptional regulator PadR
VLNASSLSPPPPELPSPGVPEYGLTNTQLSAYKARMRRKKGTLIPIERSLLEAALDVHGRGEPEFHGYGIAREMRDRAGARRLTAHGTLYRALDRLEEAGLLASRWEDPLIAADEGRPRRRLYRLTASGQRAASAAPAEGKPPRTSLRQRTAQS